MYFNDNFQLVATCDFLEGLNPYCNGCTSMIVIKETKSAYDHRVSILIVMDVLQ